MEEIPGCPYACGDIPIRGYTCRGSEKRELLSNVLEKGRSGEIQFSSRGPGFT